jgi:hypothetical protein
MDQPNFAKLTSLHFHAWSKVITIIWILNLQQFISCLAKTNLHVDNLIWSITGPENWDVLFKNTGSRWCYQVHSGYWFSEGEWGMYFGFGSSSALHSFQPSSPNTN